MARTKKVAQKGSPKEPNQDNTPSLEEIDKIVAEVEAETSGQPVDEGTSSRGNILHFKGCILPNAGG